jgi:hypothetical protein
MRDRLEVQDADLASAFHAASADAQQRLAVEMVERALAAQNPPLEFPAHREAQQELFMTLDTSDDDVDFRKARAVAAACFLRDGAYEDALYEALHAHPDVLDAVRAARRRLY